MAEVTYAAGWQLNGVENFWYSLNLSRVLRHALQPQCFFRQFCTVKDPQSEGYVGLHHGSVYHWNVYGNISDGPTEDGTLEETEEMPSGNFAIYQGTLTIKERGMSVPYTGLLDDLSFHPIKEIIDTVLSNDAKKKIDRSAYAEFNKTPLIVAPTGGSSATAVDLSTTGTTAITNDLALGRGHIKAIRDIMYKRNIPPFRAGDYGCVTSTTVLRPFKNDLEDIRKYSDQGYQQLMNGEVGRYENTRFYEQTNIADETWTNGHSAQAHFFGNDTVAQAVVIPEEMRGKIPTDFGRSKGIAWYSLLGFGIVHARNDDNSSADARIIKWGSAA